ncbi:MAG: hypothetical protein ABI679_02135 [Gemmatimonadota bacterium]
MKMFSRLATAATLVVLFGSTPLVAQDGRNPFRWYIGGGGGVTVFETPRQSRGAIAMGGANMLITARRTALLLGIDEGIGSDEQTSYIDPSATGGSRIVTFNDLRKYSATLLVYPLKSHAQPFVGVGVGLLHIVNPQPAGPFLTPDEQSNARAVAKDLGSSAFASVVAGLQLQVGAVALFGQYQLTSSPADGRLLIGPTHSFTAGLRLSLGNAREGVSGGGY